jgi:hypothetical protein
VQALWQRAHLTGDERKAKGDSLPASRDVGWFRKVTLTLTLTLTLTTDPTPNPEQVFLQPEAPLELGRDDDVWPHFVGFNEYDGLTAVVAATVLPFRGATLT